MKKIITLLASFIILLSNCTETKKDEGYDKELAKKYADRIKNFESFPQREYGIMLSLYIKGSNELIKEYSQLMDSIYDYNKDELTDKEILRMVEVEYCVAEIEYEPVFIIYKKLVNADSYDMGWKSYEKFREIKDAYKDSIDSVKSKYIDVK